VSIIGAAGYALQKALQALNLGHDPTLIMAAIDAAFDSKIGPLPSVLPAELQAWADEYELASKTTTETTP
jgi:hypothetical protein